MPADLPAFSPRSWFTVTYILFVYLLEFEIGWGLSRRDSLFLAALFSPGYNCICLILGRPSYLQQQINPRGGGGSFGPPSP